MLYNVTTMATTWHTVATRDVRLLKKQLDIGKWSAEGLRIPELSALPR